MVKKKFCFLQKKHSQRPASCEVRREFSTAASSKAAAFKMITFLGYKKVSRRAAA